MLKLLEIAMLASLVKADDAAPIKCAEEFKS